MIKTFTKIIFLHTILLYSIGASHAQVINCGAYSNSLGRLISDAAVLTDDIVISGTGPDVIVNLDVAIQINHTWMEDMDITLTSQV